MADIWNYLLGKSPHDEVTIYGSSQFMEKNEERELLSYWNKGIVIDGKRKSSNKMAYTHCTILAPTGSGKTTTVIIPNALRATKHSLVFTDPSGEILKTCGGYLQRKGYCIKVFDLSMDTDGIKESYNPIAYLKTDAQVRKFAKVIIQSGGVSGGNDPFWENGAIDIICLLTKLLLVQPSKNQNLLGLYRLLQLCTADIEQVATLFEATANDDDFLKFQAYQNYSEKLRTSILATASIALSSLSDPKVQELTNTNSLGSLYKLRTQKTALFIVIPEKEVKHTSFLLNLFVKDVLDTLMIRPKQKQQSVFVFLDEFANLYLPDVTSVFTTIRKYRVSITIAIQSISQLYSLYKQEAQTILDNTLMKIILSGVSGDSAKQVSELLGKSTVEFIKEDGQTQYIPRMLMTPSEIRTIKEDQGILIYKNRLPIKLKMKPWYKQFLLKIRANQPLKKNNDVS